VGCTFFLLPFSLPLVILQLGHLIDHHPRRCPSQPSLVAFLSSLPLVILLSFQRTFLILKFILYKFILQN